MVGESVFKILASCAVRVTAGQPLQMCSTWSHESEEKNVANFSFDLWMNEGQML